jgi:SAM-dependent methyltransferase
VNATVQGRLWSTDPQGWAQTAEGRIRPLYDSVLYAADPRRALAEITRVTAPAGRAVVTVGAGPEQAESAALINALAPRDEVPDRSTLDLADVDAARGALLDAGFASVDIVDIAFDVDFENEHHAIAAQLPAGPVAAAVRHSGRAAVEAALRSFFAPRSRTDGTVRMGLVFRCHLARRTP